MALDEARELDEDITMRRMTLTLENDGGGGGGSRPVCHYQYHAWPDHGIPETTRPLRRLAHLLVSARQLPAICRAPLYDGPRVRLMMLAKESAQEALTSSEIHAPWFLPAALVATSRQCRGIRGAYRELHHCPLEPQEAEMAAAVTKVNTRGTLVERRRTRGCPAMGPPSCTAAPASAAPAPSAPSTSCCGGYAGWRWTLPLMTLPGPWAYHRCNSCCECRN